MFNSNQKGQYRAVWDQNGEARAPRVPQDPAPMIDFHELPSKPVWKGYYAFIGLDAASTYGVRLAPKADSKLKSEPSHFTIGLVTLSCWWKYN